MNRSFKGADITPDRHSPSKGILARLTGVGTGMDPNLTLIAKQRLKARLHLEVLRVLQWCFHMLSLQYQNWPGADILRMRAYKAQMQGCCVDKCMLSTATA